MSIETQRYSQLQAKEIEGQQDLHNTEAVQGIRNGTGKQKIRFAGKNIIVLSGIIVLCILFFYTGFNIMNGPGKNLISKDKSIVDYLGKIKIQEGSIAHIYAAINDQAKILDMQSDSSKTEVINNMNAIKSDIEQTLKQLETIDPPKGMYGYREAVINMCQSLLDEANHYIDGVYENNQNSINSAQTAFQKLRNEGSERRLMLARLLDDTKIKHEIDLNGSLHYWYKTLSDYIDTF